MTLPPSEQRRSVPDDRMRTDGGDLPYSLVVEAVDDGATSEYEFSVSGDLTQIEGTVGGHEVTRDPGDDVSDGLAEGAVYGGADGFRFAGSIEWFWAGTPEAVTVYVDGEERSPDAIGASDDEAPTARISLPARTVEANTPVELRGDESTDATGPIVSYEWSLEYLDGFDSRYAMGETARVELPSAGPWRVRLTVEDDEGMTDQTVRRLTVEDDGGLEPVDSS